MNIIKWFNSIFRENSISKKANPAAPPIPKKEKANINKSLDPDLDETITDQNKAEPLPRTDVKPVQKTSPKVINEHINLAIDYYGKQEYQAAMNELISVLDTYPKNKKALEIAHGVLFESSIRNSPQQLPKSIKDDILFDGLHNQCESCFSVWVPNPLYKLVGEVVINNPIGGQCPSCNKVWCRNCSDRDLTQLKCPDCKKQLLPLKEPIGRKRGIRPPRRPHLKFLKVFVLKAPPEPRNPSNYILQVLDNLCPEAFTSQSGRNIGFSVGNEGVDETQAMMYAMVKGMMEGIQISENDNVFVEPYSADEDDKGILVTIYEP